MSAFLETPLWEMYVTDQRGCWIFGGNIRTDGYGRYRGRPAHRVSWEQAHGAIPDGLFVCHHCDVKNCINPEHLFLGTHDDNMRDAWAKGRMKLPRGPSGAKHGRYTKPHRTARGERVSSAKLTWAAVRDIRLAAAAGVDSRALAAQYGVSYPAIRKAIIGWTWKQEFSPCP